MLALKWCDDPPAAFSECWDYRHVPKDTANMQAFVILSELSSGVLRTKVLE